MESKQIFYIFLALPLMIFCFSTLFLFAYFMSSHSFLHYPLTEAVKVAETENGSHWISLFVDLALFCMFMLQHSLQARYPLKQFFNDSNYDVFERLIYNTVTCIMLQIMMYFWQPVHGWILWDLNVSQHSILSWAFSLLHLCAWAAVYTGCLLFDMSELMGLKQVYYSLRGWPRPLDQKASGLLRLYCHMRHPGFTTVTFIALVHPVMQADRFMLAYALAIYMILAFRVDQEDSTYHKRQLRIKKAELQMSYQK